MGDCFSFCNKQQGRNSLNFHQKCSDLLLSSALLPSPTAPPPATVVTPMPTNRPTATWGTTSRSTSSATRSTTPLSTPPTLNSARTSSQNTVNPHTSRFTTAPLLLVMTPRLSPMDTDTEREMLRPNLDTEAKDTHQDLSANNMLRNSARRFLTRPKDKSQDRSVSQLRSRSLMRFAELHTFRSNSTTPATDTTKSNFNVLDIYLIPEIKSTMKT